MLMLIGVIPADINTPLGHFNTSHVNVNQRQNVWAKCYTTISIHLMLMLIAITTITRVNIFYFNTSHVNVNLAPCSINAVCKPISIHLMLMLIEITPAKLYSIEFNFNTSHVNVNLCFSECFDISVNYFNTSHVNLTERVKENTRINNFNTSHVNVNLIKMKSQAYLISISIHLMLMLITERLEQL